MKTKKTRYQVYSGGEWIDVSKGEVQPSGWLHHEIWEHDVSGRSVTTALAQPKKWREKNQEVAR